MAESRVLICLAVFAVFQVGAYARSTGESEPWMGHMVEKLHSCDPLDLVTGLAKWPHFNIDACINITLDIADFERFAYNVYLYGLKEYEAGKEIGLSIYDCKSELPDVFELLKCAITQLENSGPQVTEALEGLKGLVTQLQTDYVRIQVDVKTCLGLNTTTTLVQPLMYHIMDTINNC